MCPRGWTRDKGTARGSRSCRSRCSSRRVGVVWACRRDKKRERGEKRRRRERVVERRDSFVHKYYGSGRGLDSRDTDNARERRTRLLSQKGGGSSSRRNEQRPTTGAAKMATTKKKEQTTIKTAKAEQCVRCCCFCLLSFVFGLAAVGFVGARPGGAAPRLPCAVVGPLGRSFSCYHRMDRLCPLSFLPALVVWN